MNPFLSICESFRLNLADYGRTGLRVGIWASSGRGKSFGVGVFCEELLGAGIPVIAIDPEGELYTLREAFRVVVLGGDQGDLPLPSGPAGIRLALEKALDEGLGLIIDLSEKPSSRSQQEAARPWLEELWVLLSRRRTPAALVVEEVHIFAPQSGSSVTADIMQRFAKQGRKRGVILVAASQRTQAVSKEFMSQLNFPAIGGFETERDYEAVKAVVDSHTFDEFRALEPGCFYLSAVRAFHRWRPRQTSHGGDAPAWDTGETVPVRRRDDGLTELLEHLRAAFEADEDGEAKAPDPSAAVRARIRELERELANVRQQWKEAEAEVKRLRLALQVAGVIKVLIKQEVIAQAPKMPVPTAAVQAAVSGGGKPEAQGAGTAAAPAGPGKEAPPSPTKPPVTVTKTEAKPGPPPSLVKEAGLTPDAVLALDLVKRMLRRARERARRRYKRTGEWMLPAARLLLAGHPLTAPQLAARYSRNSRIYINRISAVLNALVAVGFARMQGGQYRLNEPYLRRVILKG